MLSSSLQTDCFVDTGLCLLDDDSGLFISLIQRRRLFAGFAAARRIMMQNWCAPHVCGEAYWIAFFFSNIRDYVKEVCYFFPPSLSPF